MKPKAFKELFELIKISARAGDIETIDCYLGEAKRIHEEQRNRFIRVFVIKKIEKAFEQQRKTMQTRTPAEQNLIGAYLTVSEQNFKDEVKSLL